MNSLNNERGSFLIMVVVALALGGIVSVSLSKTLAYAFRGTAQIKLSDDRSAIRQTILQRKVGCSQSGWPCAHGASLTLRDARNAKIFQGNKSGDWKVTAKCCATTDAECRHEGIRISISQPHRTDPMTKLLLDEDHPKADLFASSAYPCGGEDEDDSHFIRHLTVPSTSSPVTLTSNGTTDVGHFSYTTRGTLIKLNLFSALQISGEDKAGTLEMRITTLHNGAPIQNWTPIYAIWGNSNTQSAFQTASYTHVMKVQSETLLSVEFRMRLEAQANFGVVGGAASGIGRLDLLAAMPIKVSVEDWQ